MLERHLHEDYLIAQVVTSNELVTLGVLEIGWQDTHTLRVLLCPFEDSTNLFIGAPYELFRRVLQCFGHLHCTRKGELP